MFTFDNVIIFDGKLDNILISVFDMLLFLDSYLIYGNIIIFITRYNIILFYVNNYNLLLIYSQNLTYSPHSCVIS